MLFLNFTTLLQRKTFGPFESERYLGKNNTPTDLLQLNVISCSTAKLLHTLSKSCRPSKLGEKQHKSSA